MGLDQSSMFSAGFDPCKVLSHQLVITELINTFSLRSSDYIPSEWQTKITTDFHTAIKPLVTST